MQTEFENAHQQVKGDFEWLKAGVCRVKKAILMCCSGDHSLCSVQSSVCNGTTSKNWIANSKFLPDTFRIDVSNPKHKQTLAESINNRLGPEILENTKLNTNTQKVQSVNQIIDVPYLSGQPFLAVSQGGLTAQSSPLKMVRVNHSSSCVRYQGIVVSLQLF